MELAIENLSNSNRLVLRKAWSTMVDHPPPPNTSQDMMRLIIGWELQAKRARSDVRNLTAALKKLGASKFLDETSKTIKRKTVLSPGTRLSRDWQGKTYTVDVLDKGYAYDGKLFTSLTPIAKAITGSHRSGPQFFGTSA